MTLEPGVLLFAQPADLGAAGCARALLCTATGVGMVEDGLAAPAGSWLTNAPYERLQHAQVHRSGFYRCEDYLGTRTVGLLSEAGLSAATQERQAEWLLTLYRRVLTLVQDHLGVDARVSRARTLALAIGRDYFRPRDTALSPLARYALTSAGRKPSYGARAVDAFASQSFILCHHRQSYAARMMAHPVPFGDWSEVAVPERDHVAWLHEAAQHRPLLLRAEVRFHGVRAADMAALAGLGSSPAGEGRVWFASPELLAYAPHATIEVAQALAADRYAQAPWAGVAMLGQVGPAGARPFGCGPLTLLGRAQLDMAVGLLAEAMWHALIVHERESATAVWLQGQDRAACFAAAARLMLAAPRVRVTGFARGRLWTHVDTAGGEPESVLTELATLAIGTGLVPPALPVPPDRSERLRVANDAIVQAQSDRDADPGLLAAALAVLGRRDALGMAGGI